MLPPQGGLPSPLRQAAPNIGGVTQQQGNQGNIAAALVKVSNALKMLEDALPLIPMGDGLHSEILKAASNLSKHLKKEEENPQLQQASLMQQIKNNQQGAQQAMMARMFSAQQGQGQPPATGQQPEAA